MSISTMNHDYFKQLTEEIESYESLSSKGGYLGFLGQEALRFHSIAGTLLEGFDFRLDETANNNERYLSHVLIRSLLESFFWIMYLFYDTTKSMCSGSMIPDTQIGGNLTIKEVLNEKKKTSIIYSGVQA